MRRRMLRRAGCFYAFLLPGLVLTLPLDAQDPPPSVLDASVSIPEVSPGYRVRLSTDADVLDGRWLAPEAGIFRIETEDGVRTVPVDDVHLEVGARVGVALLRERSTLTSDPPEVMPPYDIVDWEVSPIWTVGTTLLLPETAWPGGRPRLDARLSVITLAGDGFIPVVSVGAGWSGDDS